jgi:hypothetical protein
MVGGLIGLQTSILDIPMHNINLCHILSIVPAQNYNRWVQDVLLFCAFIFVVCQSGLVPFILRVSGRFKPYYKPVMLLRFAVILLLV